MKLLVFSDSHNNRLPLRAALRAHPDADTVLHLGDGAADLLDVLADFPHLAHCQVMGNCDSALALSARGVRLPSETVLQLEGVRLLCLHGHTRDVKMGMDRLLYRAAEVRADLVLYGHTHVPENSLAPNPDAPAKQIRLFNPGSIGLSANHPYGVIYLVNGVISADHGHA